MSIPADTLSISGFAGLKSAEFRLKPFTILIGPQGAGKSMVVKLLHYLRLLPSFILHSAENDEKFSQFENRCIKLFHSYFPREAWPKGPFKIGLGTLQGEVTISSAKRREHGIELSLGTFFPRQLDEWKDRFKQESLGLSGANDPDRYFQLMKEVKRELGFPMPSLIPAGRSYFAQLEGSAIWSPEAVSLDPFIREFGAAYSTLRRTPPPPGSKHRSQAEKAVEPLIRSILKGEYYRNEQKQDLIASTDGRNIPLRIASSGQQESLPLIYFLKRIISHQGPHKLPIGLAIEEPEAHLFPDSQRSVVELIAAAFRASNDLVQVLITTHSPFILAAVNLLISAGELYSKKLKASTKKRLEAIVPESRSLRPKQVAAYKVDKGVAELLIASDTNLIDQNPIDEYFGVLLNQFNAIQELES